MTLPDAAERRRLAQDLDATLFVEASAGAGKTTALVGRVKELLLRGPDDLQLTHVAAITFTRKAASELRARLREALRVAAPSEPKAAKALEEIDAAAIETIHSFAQRLLAQRPMQAGLPPGFAVEEESESLPRFDRWWRTVYRGLLQDPELAEAWEAWFDAELSEGALRGLAVAWTDEWDRLRDAPPDWARAPETAISRLLSAWESAAAIARICSREDDKLLEALRAPLDVGPPPGGTRGLLDWVSAVRMSKPTNKGQKGAWGGRIDEAREVGQELHAALYALAPVLRAERCGPILEALRREVLAEANRRAREGRLRFHDLLVRARDLLQEDPEARDGLRRRYRRVLIDEFQDTDPLQVEIAVMLGGEPGRIFAVGDPKQSIYRFRRADVAAFASARDRLRGEPVGLSANFRSHPEIVAWVNATFGRLFARERQAPFAEMHAHIPGEAGGRVRRLRVEVGSAVARVWRQAEAQEIARAVRTIIAEGWPVREGRPARLGDIAILMPTRSVQSALEDALAEAGVPVRVESKALIWRSHEARGLLEILRAALDSSDDLAQVAALRHPAFGLRDREIVAWRTGATSRSPEEASQRLRSLGEVAERLSPAAWVDHVIRELRLLELSVEGPRPRDAWARYRFLKECARRFASSSTFLRWCALQVDENPRIEEAPSEDPDDDAVRVTTIHAAKGLEYPVVILCDLRQWADKESRDPCLYPDGVPVVKLGSAKAGLSSAGAKDAYAAEKEEQSRENDRLLYVATTRARDYLILGPMREDSGRDGIPGARLFAAMEVVDPWTPPRGSGSMQTPEPVMADPPEFREAARMVLARAAATRSAWDATALAKAMHGYEPEPHPADEANRPGRSARPEALAVGRAVHAVLAEIDLAAPHDVAARALEAAKRMAATEHAARIEKAVRCALGTDVVRRATRGRVWREVFASVKCDGCMLEGYLDLLIEDAEGLWIVDFKTDAVGSAELARRMDAYAVQGAVYAMAIERAFGREVAGCVFVFLGGESSVEAPIHDLRTRMDAVRAFVGCGGLDASVEG